MPDGRRSGLQITVLIATLDGAERIGRCLDSLAAQSMDPDDFEILVVQNGPASRTPGLVRRFAARHPQLHVRLLELTPSGAGHARNVGAQAARGRHITYVDDDDQLSPGSLRALHDAAGRGVIPIMLMGERVDPDGPARQDNYVSRNLAPHVGGLLPVELMHIPLGFNAGRLVPTEIAREVGYDESLRSGEDLVHWMDVLARFPFRFRVVDPAADALYLRTVRAGSRGRQGADYDFMVSQRLDCIGALQRLSVRDREGETVRRQLVVAQTDWINRFLRDQPERHADVLSDIKGRGLGRLPWTALNRGLSQEIVLEYEVPSHLDTSGFAAAAGIVSRGVPVDLIHHGQPDSSAPSAGPVADLDLGWVGRARPHLARRRELEISTAADTWTAVGEYVEGVLATFDSWRERAGVPRVIRSRSSALAAHLAAARLRIAHPELTWIAEAAPTLDALRGRPEDHPEARRSVDLVAQAVAAADPEGVSSMIPSWLVLADEIESSGPPGCQMWPVRLVCVDLGAPGDRVEDLLVAVSRLPWEMRSRLKIQVVSRDWSSLGVAVARAGLADVVGVSPHGPVIRDQAEAARWMVLTVREAIDFLREEHAIA